MKKLMLTLLSIVFLFTVVLTGCSSSSGAVEGPGEIIVASDYPDAYQQYADYYEISHQEKKVNMVAYQDPNSENQEDRYVAVKKLLDNENAPDVLFLDPEIMERLAADGYLQPIDSLAKNKKYNLDEYVPGVIDYLKKKGNGTLYGIPLSFSSTALFYNKDMFDAAGIPYPTDNMTWDEVYDLARNFSEGEGADRTYGLSLGYGYENYLYLQAAQRGLMLIDDELKNVSLNTPEWREIWAKGQELIADGIIAPTFNWEEAMESGVEPGPFADNPFMGGKAAMALLDSFEINFIDERFQMEDENVQPFNWDIVTVPVQADRPGYGGIIFVNSVIAINKNSSNLDLAWDFVSYVSGDELAKVLTKSNYDTSARIKYVKKTDKEINYEALYKLEPVDTILPIPMDFLYNYEGAWEVMSPLSDNYNQVMDGKIDVDKGLETAQKQMQEGLERALEQKEKQTNEGETPEDREVPAETTP